MLTTQISGIEREAAGLRERYQRAADDAAFSFDSLENGDLSLKPKIDALTDAMSRYDERMKSLETQAALLDSLRKSVVVFMAGDEVAKSHGASGLEGRTRLSL